MRLGKNCLIALLLLFGRSAYAADGPVTFNNQVVRLFQQHCQTCHRPGNIAPFSLLTYADARPWARAIREAVLLKTMPPWKPVEAHGVFQGERTLTDQEIQTISQWVENGSPEGAAADLPDPISFPETWSAGTPNMVLQPSEPYNLQAASDDIYRCFPIPVNPDQDVYVRGYEILPGNRAIVHHVLLFIDEKGSSVNLDQADPGPGYTCFGGAGFLDGLGGLGAWVPGSSPQTFPLGTGVRVPAGARVVMQVHYSLSQFASTPGATLSPDLTRIGLYFSPTPLEPISFLPVVNTLFGIPPGESNVQINAVYPITSDVELVAVAPHMHLLGRQAVLEAWFPNGDKKQLIRIDDWDFHWQGNYIFNNPILLPAGTLVVLTATYDNSINNPRNPNNPPVLVRWGERTTDEMCLAFLSVKSPGTPSMNTVPFTLTDRGTESVITQDDSSTVQVGYARVSEDSGKAPTGLAIFGFRQNGVLISEAGVPASHLITRGRMYGETNGTARSGLAIANPNSDRAVLSFTFTDEQGQSVASNSTTIPGGGQIAAFLNEDPFDGPSTFSGAFTLNSSKPLAVVALRAVQNERGDLLLTTLPIVDMNSSSPGNGAVVFPHFADGGGWSTSFLLVNTTDSLISGALQFADSSGQPLPALTLNYSIPSGAARQFSTSGSGTTVHAGSVVVVPGQNSATPAGSLIFTYRNASVRVTEAGVPSTPLGTAFRVYVEASDSIQSGLALANSSPSAATVRIDLMNLSGASIAGTTLTIPPNAQVAKFLTDLPGFQTLSLPLQGLLRITSASSIAVVGLRGRLNERGDFLITTTPPVPESASAASESFFPHFADAGGYTTQFILFSGGSVPSLSGAMRFFSQSGQPLNLKLR